MSASIRLPIVIVGGFLSDWRWYIPFRDRLERTFSVRTFVVPIDRWDWFGPIVGGTYTTTLLALDHTVGRALAETGAERVNLIGHSAGGTIGRLYLGEKDYFGRSYAGHRRTASLVTLGTTHVSLLSWTRRNIDFINDAYPGAFYRDVAYVSVAGKSVFGKFPGTLAEMVAFNNYRTVLGRGDVWGDGVVPIEATEIPGVPHIILPEVHHLPNSEYPWYDSGLDRWGEFLR